MNRIAIPLFALSFLAALPVEAHQVGIKSPQTGMHFTAGQPIIVIADLLDDREVKGLIACPSGQTVSNHYTEAESITYPPPKAAQCSAGGTPTGWPQLQVFVEGVQMVDGFTGLKQVPNTIMFDANNNDSPIDLFPFKIASGLEVGTYQITITGLFSADGIAITPVNSASEETVTIVVDPAPAAIISLDGTNSKGNINWNDALIVGNNQAVTPTGNMVIKHCTVTGIAGFSGTVSSVDIENSYFEDVGEMNLTVTGDATIAGNEWRANNRLTFVPDDPSVPFIVNFTGSGSQQKLFQGNRVGNGQLGFSGQNWLIGGDVDADSNIFIGQRTVLNVSADNSAIRGNYSHHVYNPGMWSQGHNFVLTGNGANLITEHNFIRDSSWPIQDLAGEFRYNVVFGYGHTWIRTAYPNASIHHNLFVQGDGMDPGDLFQGFQFYHALGETGLTIYNNTFDGGVGTNGYFAGPFVGLDEGAGVFSLRNNLFTFATNQGNSNPGVAAIHAQGGGTFTSADYNAFYSPNNDTKVSYDFTAAGLGANDVSGTGQVGVTDGQLAANPFSGDRILCDNSKVIEGLIDPVIDEAAIWQGTQTMSEVLALFRGRYTPTADSPVNDAGDTQDTDPPPSSTRATIGAISRDGHSQDKLGLFGTIPSELIPPTLALTAPSAAATLTGAATISADASDNPGGTGVVLVQFRVDGGTVVQTSTAPYTATFNSAWFANGQHKLSARAWDNAGNTAVSADVTVTTQNATIVNAPPVSDPTPPSDGGSSSGGSGGSATTSGGASGNSTGTSVGTSAGGQNQVSPPYLPTNVGACASSGGDVSLQGLAPLLWLAHMARRRRLKNLSRH